MSAQFAENSSYFFFDADHYRKLGRENAETFSSNQPFPHVVINNFLPESVVQRVLAERDKKCEGSWRHYSKGGTELHRFISEHDGSVGSFTRHLLSEFNSAAMCGFIEELTGISGIVGDPYFQGGGVHSMKRGGQLGVHVDFNKQKHTGMIRRVNLLLYLNQDWKESYGGHLELWDKEMTRPVQKVLPAFNRCAIFQTSEYSFHGVPDALNCPRSKSRDCIGLYYYTKALPDTIADEAHSTIWRERPGDASSGSRLQTLEQKTTRLVESGFRMVRKLARNGA